MKSRYRILIVDDEPFIVNGLAELCLGAEFLELEVYKAYSSSEALGWLKRAKMDIVLSDIKMPGLNGIALQKEISRQWPHCKVIFDRIRRLFLYPGGHPARKRRLRSEGRGNDAVLSAIEKTVELLDQEIEKDILLAKARTICAWRCRFTAAVRAGADAKAPGHIRREELEQRFAELEMKLDPGKPCLLLICRLDGWQRQESPSAQSLMLYAVQNIIGELLGPMTDGMGVEFGRAKMIWILQHKEESEEHLEEVRSPAAERVQRFVHGMLEQIQDVCKTLLKLKTSFAMAGEWVDWERLPDKFEGLKQLLDSGLGIGHESLLTEAGERNRPDRIGHLLGRSRSHVKRMELLRGCLNNGDREEFMQLFHEVTDPSSFPPEVEYLLKMEVYYGLVSVMMPSLVDMEALCRNVEGKGRWIISH